jgi:hypothetical protein
MEFGCWTVIPEFLLGRQTWPAVPAAGPWLVGRNLGLTTSVAPWAVEVLGRWSNAAAWMGGIAARRVDAGQPRDPESAKRVHPFSSKRSIGLPTSTTTKAGHFDIYPAVYTLSSSMERYRLITLAKCHHFPDASSPRAAHPSPLCSNRDRRRHPALNPIHLHAAVDRLPACVVSDPRPHRARPRNRHL